MVKDVFNLLFRIGGIDTYGNPSEALDCKVCKDPFRAILSKDGGMISLFHSEFQQPQTDKFDLFHIGFP